VRSFFWLTDGCFAVSSYGGERRKEEERRERERKRERERLSPVWCTDLIIRTIFL
jgi:hypothetical protein